MPVCGFVPGGNIAMAAKSLPIRNVARQALTALRAYFEPLARVLTAALALSLVNQRSHGHSRHPCAKQASRGGSRSGEGSPATPPAYLAPLRWARRVSQAARSRSAGARVFLTFGDVPVSLREMPALLLLARHRFAFSSTRRPSSVIRTRATSWSRPPAA